MPDNIMIVLILQNTFRIDKLIGAWILTYVLRIENRATSHSAIDYIILFNINAIKQEFTYQSSTHQRHGKIAASPCFLQS